MNYSVKSGNPEKQRVGCVIVGIYDRRKPSEAAETLDQACGGAISSALRRGDLDGKSGRSLILHNLPHMFCDRVLLVGLGRERDFDEAAFRKACALAARTVRNTGAIDAVSYLTHLPVKNRPLDQGFHWNVRQATLATQDEFYRFDACRGSKAKSDLPKYKLERLTFDVPRRSDLPEAERGLKEALAISAGVTLTKNLGNLPPNLCTPTHLAEQAQQLAREHASIKTRVLEREDLEKLGMGAFLSVTRGSRQPPKLILLQYSQGARG
ncbi:MAG: leucyl aminopeptidase, partial [Hydrocarboniphaga effusa]|nr:leucyl aminopeptidase [Hydrocarboniphaga effusa]